MNTEQSKNVRDRRLLAPVPVCKSKQLFDLPVKFATSGFRGQILDWIADYTSGEFYLSSTVLYFCDEQDAMAYKLYDARNKCEEEVVVKKKLQDQMKLQDVADKLHCSPYPLKFNQPAGRLKK